MFFRRQNIPKTFWLEIIFVRKYFLDRFFRSKLFDPRNIFRPKFIFDQNILDFFVDEKIFDQKKLPIPMRNFPKIPKIILRTACEHLKKLEQKVTVNVLLHAHGIQCHVINSTAATAQVVWFQPRSSSVIPYLRCL